MKTSFAEYWPGVLRTTPEGLGRNHDAIYNRQGKEATTGSRCCQMTALCWGQQRIFKIDFAKPACYDGNRFEPQSW